MQQAEETAHYEYCVPEWFEEPDWPDVYESLDASNIWTLEPDSLTRDSLSVEDQWWCMWRLVWRIILDSISTPAQIPRQAVQAAIDANNLERTLTR